MERSRAFIHALAQGRFRRKLRKFRGFTEKVIFAMLLDGHKVALPLGEPRQDRITSWRDAMGQEPLWLGMMPCCRRARVAARSGYLGVEFGLCLGVFDIRGPAHEVVHRLLGR